MTIPTKRLDGLDSTINPQRDHEVAAMRDGISNRLRVEQILALLQSSDIPNAAVTLAKLAADARAAGNVTFDDTDAQLGETDVQGAIEAAKALIDAIPEIIQSDTRQTVNTGPVDSNGRADFLASGTGLEVVTTGLTTTPLNLTMGDGFGPRGKVDLSFEVDANLSWGSLPDATDPIYLYLEWDGSTLSTGHSTLAPEYELAKPSSPATGQYWYPTDHRSRGERWDGAEWVPVLRVYVGECATSGGSVVSVTSYAYQGQNKITQQGSTSVAYVHNIGLPFEDLAIVSFKGRLRVNTGSLVIGDIVDFGNTHDTASTTRNMAFVSRAADNNLRNAVRLFGRNETFHVVDSESSNTTSFGNFDFSIHIRRAW